MKSLWQLLKSLRGATGDKGGRNRCCLLLLGFKRCMHTVSKEPYSHWSMYPSLGVDRGAVDGGFLRNGQLFARYNVRMISLGDICASSTSFTWKRHRISESHSLSRGYPAAPEATYVPSCPFDRELSVLPSTGGENAPPFHSQQGSFSFRRAFKRSDTENIAFTKTYHRSCFS